MFHRRLLFTTGLLMIALSASQNAAAEGQFVDIEPKNQSEIQLVLDTLESSIGTELTDIPPIVMMLHGDEAHRFLRANYATNKSLVDQTAKLAAYDVIKVQICATWMAMNNYSPTDLFPFVSTVPYGAGELERLANDEGYEEFSVDL